MVVRAQNLHKWYGPVHALDGVNLEVRRGEVMGFLGPNGAGKTTFTKCSLGFLKPTSGRVELFGTDVHRHPREILGRVGLVPDQYDFYGNLNGIQHLRFYGRLYGISKAKLQTRIPEVLQVVGMSDRAHRRVREYSHGMKQRLCIAQALLNEPEFIIFDEPTNGLDPKGAYEIRELIKNLSRQGVTIFLSSHILPEVEQVCTRVAILSRGRIVTQASVGELRSKMRAGKAATVVITLERTTSGLERVAITKGGARTAKMQEGRLVCELESSDQIPRLVSALAGAGASIRDVREEVLGLEEIFLQLTQGEGGL